MRRREFIAGLGGAAAWPFVARAQPRAVPVVGILGSTTAAAGAPVVSAFMQGLKDTGFVEGQNVAIVAHWANDQHDLLPTMVLELVRTRAGLIFATGNNLTARIATGATPIPIVFATGGDPVQLHITGFTALTRDHLQIRLQLLHDAVPTAKVFGLIINPDNFGPVPFGLGQRMPDELAQDVVSSWGGTIEIAQTRTVGDFDAAFASFAERRINALTTQSNTLFRSGHERLVELAARYAIPMILHAAALTRFGGLMSYTVNATDSYRQAGRYGGRILKSDIPCAAPDDFRFLCP
jgi:putative tryptophan/tyrosine transport system substrate-binding protein